ncbi:MAG: hypothetical protein K6347_02095 [Campylobacterales bacterium]
MSQVYTPNVNYIDEDEIDLRELGRTIWRHKGKIITTTLTITLLAVLFVLAKPNTYKSSTILIPQEQPKVVSGGLGALAAMAGVVLDGGTMQPDQAYQALLNDYEFMKNFINKYHLVARLNAPDADKNYRFALGYDGLYRMLKGSPQTQQDRSDPEKEIFNIYKTLKEKLSISADKKTSMITISYEDPDRFLARDIVASFLKEASAALRENELQDMTKKIAFYNEELAKTNDIIIKQQLSLLISALIQKEVLAKASEYYNVKPLVLPQVPNEKDKSGPKRALIVVVSFVTSMILSIFGVFFLEFIRGGREETPPCA